MVGLVPALQASRNDLHARRPAQARVAPPAAISPRARALVVAEVALALVLLVGAGLLLRSLERLFAIAPGFDPRNVLTMQVQTAGRRFDDDNADASVLRAGARGRAPRARRRARQRFTSQLPLSGDVDVYGVQFESDASQATTDEDRGAFRYAVSPGYFEAMGIPVRRGRSLDARDTAGARRWRS